ncbi:hypothetical protein RB600_006486 [Gaeumannomyces tritici]
MEKQYTEIEIAEACRLVNGGLSIRSAAAAQGIPYSTFRSRYRGAQDAQACQEKYQRLSKEEETHLANWVAIQAALGLPPTHGKLRFFATEILRTTGDFRPLRKHWIEGFFTSEPSDRSPTCPAYGKRKG